MAKKTQEDTEANVATSAGEEQGEQTERELAVDFAETQMGTATPTTCTDCGEALSEFNLENGHTRCSTCHNNARNTGTVADGPTCRECGNALTQFNIEHRHTLCSDCAKAKAPQTQTCDCGARIYQKPHGDWPEKCRRCTLINNLVFGRGKILEVEAMGHTVEPEIVAQFEQAEALFKKDELGKAEEAVRRFNLMRQMSAAEYEIERFSRKFVPANDTGNPDPELLSPEARTLFYQVIDAISNEEPWKVLEILNRIADIVEEEHRETANAETLQAAYARMLIPGRTQATHSPQTNNGAFGRGDIGPKPEDEAKRFARRTKDRAETDKRKGGGRG